MIDKSNWNPPSLMWLGGLLEGKGSFFFDMSCNNLVVSCEMTDYDVIDRCRWVAGTGTTVQQPAREGRKPIWKWRSACSLDVYELEKELFFIMGQRRRQQILDSHIKRRDYEFFTTGRNLRRIFTTERCELLPDTI
jgi:hypothetical protein